MTVNTIIVKLSLISSYFHGYTTMVFKKLPYQYGLGPCVQNLQELDITGFIQVIVYALFAYPKISQFLVPVKFLMEEFCRNIIFTRLISCRC